MTDASQVLAPLGCSEKQPTRGLCLCITRIQTSSGANNTYIENARCLGAARPRSYQLSLLATLRHGTALIPAHWQSSHEPPLHRQPESPNADLHSKSRSLRNFATGTPFSGSGYNQGLLRILLRSLYTKTRRSQVRPQQTASSRSATLCQQGQRQHQSLMERIRSALLSSIPPCLIRAHLASTVVHRKAQ